MLSSTVVGAIIGGGLALLGTGISELAAYLRSENTRQTQNIRYHAEFYMDEKVNRLTNLHSILIQIRQHTGRLLHYPKRDSDVSGELVSRRKSLAEAIEEASIFLSDQQTAEMWATARIIDRASIYIMRSNANDSISMDVEPPRLFEDEDLDEFTDKDIDKFMSDIENATTILKREINEPIDRFESLSE